MVKTVVRIPVLVVFLLAASTGWALKVSPGSFSVQNIPLGQEKDLNITLVCSAEGADYIFVSVLPPGASTPHCTGYEPLPNPSWFIVDSETLATDSSGTARSKMKIFIPDSQKYYNQHFVVRLFISASGNNMFQPAIIPYYFIETPPLDDTNIIPAGKIAVVPSVLELKKQKNTASFTIFNNDSIAHNYNLSIRKPERSSRRFPNLSPNFSIIDDTTYIKISDDRVNIKGKSKEKIFVELRSSVKINTPKEAILLIESDDGTSNFLRIRIPLDDEKQ